MCHRVAQTGQTGEHPAVLSLMDSKAEPDRDVTDRPEDERRRDPEAVAEAEGLHIEQDQSTWSGGDGAQRCGSPEPAG
jgi:hypothetical protein